MDLVCADLVRFCNNFPILDFHFLHRVRTPKQLSLMKTADKAFLWLASGSLIAAVMVSVDCLFG